MLKEGTLATWTEPTLLTFHWGLVSLLTDIPAGLRLGRGYFPSLQSTLKPTRSPLLSRSDRQCVVVLDPIGHQKAVKWKKGLLLFVVRETISWTRQFFFVQILSAEKGADITSQKRFWQKHVYKVCQIFYWHASPGGSSLGYASFPDNELSQWTYLKSKLI